MWYSVRRMVCLICLLVQVTAWSIPLRHLGVHTTVKESITGRSASEDTITLGAPPAQQPGITDNVRSAETTSYKDTMNGVTLERLLADLETCVEELVPYSPEIPPSDLVQISGSKMRSCRQAIFTLIRWYRQSNPSASKSSTETQNERRDDQKSRFNLVKPGDNTDPRQTGSLQPTATGKARPTQTATRPLTCRELACPSGDLAATCVTKPGIKLKPTLAQMCRMCFPRRDERLIDEHCADKSKKEWDIFYILFAILISISTTGFTLVIIRRLKEKAQNSQNTASEVLPTKRFVDSSSTFVSPSPAEPMSRRVVSWLKGVVAYFRNSRARADVEEHPELGVAAANSLIPTFVNQANSTNHPHPFQVSGAETCERQTGLKLRKSCDSSLDVPGKKETPRARSSSVQATPEAVNEP
ncbi:hypothetical protein H112_00889 [Trichophyton rubrum D6]|uniref:Uncharacterized protein n=4 Tax=Trichophyton TaxID=5550 RepID=A0A178F3V9_TRIRU|nr:uncharacterized protein TERG_07996 [Trichophyton rubrum CBS 118892]EZF27089.1 hypothetical protein H100_00886 [Trichophyton rubrum MR850]EZF46185.1 hypothetical protein H102_00879 [Trichophyton rubrum CBS 100081]EZF56802.1 hypothetical protein H103_00887 [Trichophyton rubrum CBS 288.86]EZF67329.1 hypothetical protein H104_00870 [Trichophyton rubrum CBS 289.86]EZF88665.1 hypothetical protein H110_00886 [Trichophyton rubrum MR1448]EZF99453.1 hypothetical protein H113_00887 [Trichophyton rubr